MLTLPNSLRSLIFQSTSPYAGDDAFFLQCLDMILYFNPRPPTRGTTPCVKHMTVLVDISIHVPLRGGRHKGYNGCNTTIVFQSTSPYAGDDNVHGLSLLNVFHFNPRPPTRGTTAKLYKIFGGFCSLFATIITKRIIRPGIAFAF